jgi:cyclophilin family peptidyl-prolyl cis-trans isomerase
MRRLTRRIWNFLTAGSRGGNSRNKPARPRLELEYLESRALLSANFTGTLTGTVFLDSNGNHVRDSGELAMAGVKVTLSGTTTQNVAVKVSANSNGKGIYAFDNVLPGTYTLSSSPVSALINGGAASSGSFTLGNGQTQTHNLGLTGKLNPAAVSVAEFLTTTNGVTFDFGSLGSPTNVNYRPDSAPIVSKAVSPVAVNTSSAPTNIDLAGSFSDPDMTNSLITFNISDGKKTLAIQLQLFDKQTPQTVANFFDYIQAHAFDDSIFHRLETAGSGLEILQGGAITLNGTGNGFATIPIITPGTGVPNEFIKANSNTFGTIAMAQSAGNPNSGTDQFFFNTGNNAKSLDSQKFAVFGKVVSVSDAALTTLTKTPTPNITIPSTLQSQFPTVAFTDPGTGKATVPLVSYTQSGANFPTDATQSNFVVINSITINKRDEFLTYSIQSNSNPSLVTPTIKNEWLTLTYAAGQTGTADIVVVATDRYGATVTQKIHVTVGQAPTVTNVAITPNSTSGATTLTATPSSTDPQGLPVTYTYQWLHNGTAITGQTSQTLTLSSVTGLAANDTISVTVTPSDSAPFTGAAFTSSAITVSTTSPITFKLPAVTGVTITPDNANDVATLTAAPTSTDPLGKSVTYTYQWLHNGTAITGQTSATLSLSGITVAATDTFSVKVTPSDGVLTGTAFTSGTVTASSASPTVAIEEPVVSNVIINPDNASAPTTLTAIATGANAEGGTLSFTYQWLLNSNPIANATSQSLSGLISGDTYAVVVTPFDGTVNGTPFTSSNFVMP